MKQTDPAWSLQRALTEWLESHWELPDAGLWEVRGPERHFTHSKVMAWVALDRAIKTVEGFQMPGPVERWRRLRQTIHESVCSSGWNPGLRSFTQYYGGESVDAALLLIPAVGFLPPSDPRVLGTVERVERELLQDGFVLRYRSNGVDGLPGAEGAFLACSFWLVDAYALIGRRREARALYERLVSLANDVGLLSEEYDTRNRRLVGNFPQAFSHVALVNSTRNLTCTRAPTEERRHT